MPTKESIKRELEFSKNMAEILDVMKQLAQSQFTVAKKIVIASFGGHLLSLSSMFKSLLSVEGTHPLIRATTPNIGIVVTTSDQAFMGALNSKLAKTARQAAGKISCTYLVTGRKGARKFKFNRVPFVGFNAIKEGAELRTLTREMTDYIMREVCEGRLGRLYIVSAFSNSFSSIEIRANQLLPFEEVIPKKEAAEAKGRDQAFILESDLKKIAEYAGRMWLYHSLIFFFRNNKPAEFGSLAMQMEGSCENVKKVINKLNIAYKRARNDKVDANIREIFVSTMVSQGG